MFLVEWRKSLGENIYSKTPQKVFINNTSGSLGWLVVITLCETAPVPAPGSCCAPRKDNVSSTSTCSPGRGPLHLSRNVIRHRVPGEKRLLPAPGLRTAWGRRAFLPKPRTPVAFGKPNCGWLETRDFLWFVSPSSARPFVVGKVTDRPRRLAAVPERRNPEEPGLWAPCASGKGVMRYFCQIQKGACPEQDAFCLVRIQLEVTLSSLSVKIKCSWLEDFGLSCRGVYGFNSHTQPWQSPPEHCVSYHASSTVRRICIASLIRPGCITIRVIITSWTS